MSTTDEPGRKRAGISGWFSELDLAPAGRADAGFVAAQGRARAQSWRDCR